MDILYEVYQIIYQDLSSNTDPFKEQNSFYCHDLTVPKVNDGCSSALEILVSNKVSCYS